VGVSTVNPPVKRDEFPLLMTIEPVMKGIPGSVSEASFDFSIVPVLYDRGTLSLVLPDDVDRESLEISINGAAVDGLEDSYTLPTGIHELEVSSPYTLPFTTTFGIEQGEATEVRVKLEPARASVSFEAPEEAVIYFDGTKLSDGDFDRLAADPGEHVVLVKLGEYSLSKKIHLERGQNYKVSLFFDILVDED
jgi:hypothetical protein